MIDWFVVSPGGDGLDPAGVAWDSTRYFFGVFCVREPGMAAAARAFDAMKLLFSNAHVPNRTLFVARDGRYFSVSGKERVDLSARGPLRRIFCAIVKAHRDGLRRGLSVHEVFEAGWPGETAYPDALAGRVYSAISKLRRMELGEVIIRTDAAGYRLDPRCCLIEEAPLTRLAS
jgi:hypothetical protein